MNQVLEQFRQRVLDAGVQGTPLQLRGGGTKDWYGQAPRGALLDTRAYTGIIDYDPTELVITARCGTPLAEIEAALDQKNQMLAFEPPYYGDGATLGGVVASGLSGPRRAAAGAVRDFMLGAVLMDGHGEVLHFGGQVMKNVAGYDVSRLLAGSLGTLGLLLEMSVKVLPKPYAETTRQLAMSHAQAIEQLNAWGGQPLPISASAWCDGQLMVRLSGARAAVAAAEIRIGGDVVGDPDSLWRDLREQGNTFFADEHNALWRLSVPSVTPPVDLPGAQLIEWGGAQRWLQTSAPAAAIRAAASKAGGHATLYGGDDKSVGVFHPLAPAVAAIHRRLKTSFDPAGIFNPGRLYSEL
ncbi:glycolate oxidase subunit GlcE [Actimicrobium sp. CCI2.3]|uniref:glycolate oxidase subunit GlcE n=1 Tax=Actimicrobium sp. CCI2.3 TaxID=3048616 RepID=UPI002AB5DC88|nr:glycolate oxidase subunit GlcE [Actimicrobium sp. CCI2.3]MDY7573740.1 glycolate oxidase subunit GlcE [Actimicrobium sp. CCI2.3]MEB0020987.1 glycolate oxidase subunit GlcE [Actimicrobium sp. CCI2.3]